MHRRTAAAFLVALATTACQDEPDFGLDEWEAEVDTVTLYTVDRAEYQGLPSAYDIRGRRTVRVEDGSATGNWDFALTGGANGQPLTLTPLGAFFRVASQAGIATVDDRTFEELENAPADTAAYVVDTTVTAADEVVYVIRSRLSSNCSNFAKVDPLAIDATAGTLTFRVTANPLCNDRALVPPEDD